MVRKQAFLVLVLFLLSALGASPFFLYTLTDSHRYEAVGPRSFDVNNLHVSPHFVFRTLSSPMGLFVSGNTAGTPLFSSLSRSHRTDWNGRSLYYFIAPPINAPPSFPAP